MHEMKLFSEILCCAHVPPGADVSFGICVYHELGLHRVMFCHDEALCAAAVAATDACEAFGGAGALESCTPVILSEFRDDTPCTFFCVL